MFQRLVAAVLAFCAFSVPVRAQAPLPAATVELLRAANIGTHEIGAIAIRLDDGKVLLAHGAERDMQPASTLKTLTSIVGLERLGPAWRARTTLQATAGIRHGVLEGDLYLKGGGSPDFDWRALQRMLQELRFAGVRRIAGDVVLDRTAYRPARADLGVPPFDETPEFRYNVIPDALELNTNLVRLDLSSSGGGVAGTAGTGGGVTRTAGMGGGAVRVAGTGGSTVRAHLSPTLDGVSVDARGLALVEARCADWEDHWQLPEVRAGAGGRLTIVLRGAFPRDCTATTEINVIERTTFADRLFRATWRGLGGRLGGKVVEGETPRQARVLAGHASRTLAEFNRDVLKRSDNPITRQMYLALGAGGAGDSLAPGAAGLAGPTGTTGAADTAGALGAGMLARDDSAARAEQVVRGWLAAHGLDATGLVLENGSGLSRREMIRPRLLAGVLAAAARSPWAPEFHTALPIVGVDGAMRNRLRGSPAAAGGRFKTGGLRNVASVAGFVPDAAGRVHAVVAIVNHDGEKKDWGRGATAALDSVIDWVARSGAQ